MISKMANNAAVKFILKLNKSKTSKIKVELRDKDNEEVKDHVTAFDGGELKAVSK